MPVAAYPGPNSYTANGVTTVFAYSFRILDEADLQVYVDGTLKTLTTHYTVSGVGDANGGNVTFVTAPANAAAVVIARERAYERETDYQRGGSFDEETVDADFDGAEMQVQQLAAALKRAFKAPLSVTSDLVLSTSDWSARASTILGFDASGNFIVRVPADLSLASVSAFIATLLDDTTAGAARTTLGLGTMATANSVAAANIDAGAVTEAKLASDAVTQAKLAASTFNARSTGRNFGSSNTNSAVTFTADEFIVADTNGKTYKLTSVNVTADITASGANGLDTGAEASNTWYFEHVIYNPTTDTKAALLSLSATAPTLPSGYTAWGLASARRNDGSSNFIAMTQKGTELSYSAKQSLLSSGTATTETSVTTSTFLPSVAHDFQLEIESFLVSNASAAQNSSIIRVATGANFAKAHSYCGFSIDTDIDMNMVRVPNTGNLYYLNSTGGSVTSATTSLSILSFSLPIGGQ